MRHFLFSLLSAGFLLSSTARANELELLFYRAPQPLDWSTPGSLIRTTLRNGSAKVQHNGRQETYKHSISHVDVKVQCGSRAPVYRGMTGTKSDLEYAFQLFVMGDALETLITGTGGRLYKNDEILSWLPDLERQGFVRSLRLNVSDAQCERALDYLARYESLGLEQIYGGLRDDPRLGQGAGCSAFAASVLEVLGLDAYFQKDWKRRLSVPEELMTTWTHFARINIPSYLAGADRSWARAGEPAVPLWFWDPERMYSWVGDVTAGRVAPPFPVKKVIAYPGKFQVLAADVSAVPLPNAPYFRLGERSLLQNAAWHRSRRDKLPSDEELRSPLLYECEHFRGLSSCR